MAGLRRACARPGGRGLIDSVGQGFVLRHRHGTAAELVGIAGDGEGGEYEEGRSSSHASLARSVVACHVLDRALVIGSTQSASDADETWCAGLGISVVRRRSGGGAVYVAPGSQVWIDVFVPVSDQLFDADVGRSFLWLGERWAVALRAAGVATSAEIAVAPAGTPATRWARRLCFGSLGAGEVTLAGRKVVGLSQRRDRRGAWLHSMALVEDTSPILLDCLLLDAGERAEAAEALRVGAGWLPVPAVDLLGAVVATLV